MVYFAYLQKVIIAALVYWRKVLLLKSFEKRAISLGRRLLIILINNLNIFVTLCILLIFFGRHSSIYS